MQSRCSGSLNTPVPSTSYGEQVHKAVLKQATSVCGHRRRRGRSRALQCSAILGLFRKEEQKPYASVEDKALLEWLHDKGLPKQKVSLADCGDQGRGLVAQDRIKEGEAILQVPEALLLTPELCLQHSRLAPVLADAELPNWSLLALYLVDADTAAEEGIQLPWSSYVTALPRSSGCVLEWTPEQVKALKGSPAAARAGDMLQAAERSWEQLEPLIRTAGERGLIPAYTFTKGRLFWGLSMLLSRLARLPTRRNIEACIPWADFLNHSPSANCFLDWDERLRAVVLRPSQSYKSGEQVFTSYGPKTDGELLLSYGFAPDVGSNPDNAYRLTMAVDDKDPMFWQKQQALGQHKLSVTIIFPLKLSGVPSGLLQYAAFIDAQPTDPAEVNQLADYLFGKGQFPVLDGVNTELLGIEVILDECRRALAAYPSSLESSQQQLASQQTHHPGSLIGSILSVRMQEQKILHRAVFTLQQQRRDLQKKRLSFETC